MALDGGSTLTKDGKGVNSQVNYTVNSLKLQGQDMGSGKLTLKVDNVDGQAWHQFSQQYSAQSQALLAKPELAQNPELYQQALTETLFNALPILLKGNPSVTISPLSWRNAKGESTLNLSVLLKDPAQVTTPPQTLADSLDRAVQSLDGKLVIPVDMATEFMTKIAGLEGLADAAKLADQQVKGLAAMGQMFRITTMEDNAISSSLQYANGQVTLNGQKMPLEDFAAMFGLEAPSLPDRRAAGGQPQQDDAALSRTTPPRSRNLSVRRRPPRAVSSFSRHQPRRHNLVSPRLSLLQPPQHRLRQLLPISRAGVVTQVSGRSSSAAWHIRPPAPPAARNSSRRHLPRSAFRPQQTKPRAGGHHVVVAQHR
jgi:phage tail protein X